MAERTDGIYIDSITLGGIQDGGDVEFEVVTPAGTPVSKMALAVTGSQTGVDLSTEDVSSWPNEIRLKINATEGQAFKTVTLRNSLGMVEFIRDFTPITDPVLTAMGVTLGGSAHTFTWSDPSPITGRRYQIAINGITKAGNVMEPVVQWFVTGLPVDGNVIAVELFWWDNQDLATIQSVSGTVTAHTATTGSGTQFIIPDVNIAEGAYNSVDFEAATPSLTPIYWEAGGDNITTVSLVGGRRAVGVRLDGTVIPSTRVNAGSSLAPSQKATLEQWVYFDAGFDWGGSNEGGKLGFGLAGGSRKAGGLAGPDDTDTQTGFTVRFMWRTNGALVAYVYDANTVGYGDDYATGVTATRATWIKTKMEVEMNSAAGVADGKLTLWIDGVLSFTASTFEWFGQGTPQVDALLFVVFHGGDDSSWTPSRVNHVYFNDIFWALDAEAVPNADPTFQAPAQGSVATSADVTFAWSGATGYVYDLHVYTDAARTQKVTSTTGNVYDTSGIGTATSHTFYDDPSDGAERYVRLYWWPDASYTNIGNIDWQYTSVYVAPPPSGAFNESQIYGGLFYGHGMALGKAPANAVDYTRHFIRFRAIKSQEITKVDFDIRIGPNYSSGTGGVIKYAILADDGSANHYPDLTGLVYAESDSTFVPGSNATNDFYPKVLNMANRTPLVAGQIYHVGIINIDPDSGRIPINGSIIPFRGSTRYQSRSQEAMGPWYDAASSYHISDHGDNYGPLTSIDPEERDIEPWFEVQYADGTWDGAYFTQSDYPSAENYDTSKSNASDCSREMAWIDGSRAASQEFTVSQGNRIVDGLWSHYGHHKSGGYPNGSTLKAELVRVSDGAVLATVNYDRDIDLYNTTLEVNETGNAFLDYTLRWASAWKYKAFGSNVTLVNGQQYRTRYTSNSGGNYMMFATPSVSLGDPEKSGRGIHHFGDGIAARVSFDGGSSWPQEVDTVRDWGGKLGMLFTTSGAVRHMKDYVG